MDRAPAEPTPGTKREEPSRASWRARTPVRSALLVSLVSLAALLVAGCSPVFVPPTGAKEASDRPNVIFVLADDLDYASAQKMPNLRSLLAKGGPSFENAFASQSLCCPSRATILTGLYAHNSGIQGNKPPDGGFEVFRDEGLEESSIAASLQESGYQTAFFGKYLNGYGAEDPEYVPPGWDEWYGKLQEQKLYDYEINENGEVVSYGSEEEDYLTDVLSGHTTDFARRSVSEDQPFFAYVAPTAPHSPATPAERHEGDFAGEEAPRTPSFDEEDVSDKPAWLQETEPVTEKEASRIDARHQQRLESMLAVDEMVGSLAEELEEAGELENTYIIFTSDNGYHLGTHRLRHGKKTPYEEAAHVPLFVRGPGVAAGSSVEEMVLNNDFAPTFAELAGLKEFKADGRSLVSLMRGEEPPSGWRSTVLLEAFLDGKSADEEGDAETDDEEGTGEGNRTDQTNFRSVRTTSHKYVEHGNGERELYDLQNDPHELENLYETADPTLIEDLKGRLEALKECAGDGCREAEDTR